MGKWGDRLRTWLAGNRAAKRFCRKVLPSLLPEVLDVEITGTFKLAVDSRDLTGPSFYVCHGGPAAFYHYEEAEKGEIVQALGSHGTFLDVGANIGLFSVFVSRLFPQASVHAFEPHPRNFRCLSQTAAVNRLTKLIAVQACVGAGSGRGRLFLHGRDSGGHSMRRDQFQEGENVGSVDVLLVSVDDYVKQQSIDSLQVMKIDVQGGEWEVLSGAQTSISRFRPKLVIELDNQWLAENPHEFLARFSSVGISSRGDGGYGVRRVGESKFNPLALLPRLASEDLRAGRIQTNFVFEFQPR